MNAMSVVLLSPELSVGQAIRVLPKARKCSPPE